MRNISCFSGVYNRFRAPELSAKTAVDAVKAAFVVDLKYERKCYGRSAGEGKGWPPVNGGIERTRRRAAGERSEVGRSADRTRGHRPAIIAVVVAARPLIGLVPKRRRTFYNNIKIRSHMTAMFNFVICIANRRRTDGRQSAVVRVRPDDDGDGPPVPSARRPIVLLRRVRVVSRARARSLRGITLRARHNKSARNLCTGKKIIVRDPRV